MKIVNYSSVEYIDHMGSDDSIVNAARVSFDKLATNYTGEQNEKLINYLAKHNHWSPFAHTSISLRICSPVFVARQLVKHQVGGVWNEVSRRYVDDEPEFYIPDEWRGKPLNAKQGSSEPLLDQYTNREAALNSTKYAADVYKILLQNSVAPEQARTILPQNMMTSWVWTGSLLFFHRVYKQRTDPHTQLETQEVGHKIGDICEKLYPISWASLCGTSSNS